MKTCILTVGTEILFGQVVNTNAQFLSRELNNLGHDVMYHKVVGDNEKRFMENLEEAYKDCELIITTGGLGPTQDDLTKETIAKFFDRDMIVHEPSMDLLNRAFKGRGVDMPRNNLKQAYIPEGAEVLKNSGGTAPGFYLEDGHRKIIALPGPPGEMKLMFAEGVVPKLKSFMTDSIYYRFVRTFGIGESELEMKLMPLIDKQTDPTFATYAQEGEAYIRVTSKRKTQEEAKTAVDAAVSQIEEIVGEYVYSTDGEEISKIILEKMKKLNLTLASAESCTGGAFASEFIKNDGASKVFDRGIVSYSNRAKVSELGVSEETLKEYGPVSIETAKEMAIGIREKSDADIGISITGNAGPEPEDEKEPVGIVYIGLSTAEETYVKKHKIMNRGRNYIRNRSVLIMFHEILNLLEVYTVEKR